MIILVEDVLNITFDSIELADTFYIIYSRCVGFEWGKSIVN